ncbi:MAG: type II secretion system F family protein [Oligosphaeraceae bacterium]|nr:type II secretion system F family protein [Oligosphaeraceae bacterium]
MALFRFKVSDDSGKLSELLIEGESQADATRRLQRRGLMPIEFLGQGSVADKRGGLFAKKLDVVDFTERLVPLLEANIQLERALTIVGEDQDNPMLNKTAAELRQGLHEGRKLSDLISERSHIFPSLYAGVVEAGEEAGALPQVMAELRNFLSEARELKAFIVSASVYPLFIAISGIVMLIFVLSVIVPRFATILTGAGVESTAATILLALSGFFQSYWWLLLLLLLLFGFLLLQLRNEDGIVRKSYDRWILHVPIAGQLVRHISLARLCRTMAILMRSGVHLLNTVVIANRVVRNSEIRRSLQELSGELRQGQRISAALAKSPYIPSLMLRMIAVGEETGEVESMLERVAERYETELRRSIKRLLSLFEPLIIILLGLGVGFIVLLMFMVMMDMQTVA